MFLTIFTETIMLMALFTLSAGHSMIGQTLSGSSMAGAMNGVSKVLGRLLEFMFGRRFRNFIKGLESGYCIFSQ